MTVPEPPATPKIVRGIGPSSPFDLKGLFSLRGERHPTKDPN